MKVLILGSGGREHALAYRLVKDEGVSEVVVMPGNPGIELSPSVSTIGENENNKEEVLRIAKDLDPALIVIGPEKPLVMGMTDFLEENGFKVFGPSSKAAELEGSKIFSKKIMDKYKVPTAKSENYPSLKLALKGLDSWNFKKGIVIKSDALAGGKGVVVTHSREIAEKTLNDFMNSAECSVTTENVLIEEKLLGKELSIFAICDGASFKVIGRACDYKRIGDGDTGPNTGGMGCYNPINWPHGSILERIEKEVFSPILKGMVKEKRPYKGVLFAGLMIKDDEINVIEFNARFGDPETQVLMPLLEGNLFENLLAAAKGNLEDTAELKISNKQALHIVVASEGYPSIDNTPLNLGHPVSFAKSLVAGLQKKQNDLLFMAGVKKDVNGALVNSGGRVFGLTTIAKDLKQARNIAYSLLKKDLRFTGAYWRSDIGK
ncbi:MAG: phosphoribosylamine--glycine ligase [Halobacteriovoraceae bacterium]|jgi:phosphoribosylamine---glycine ligase|nr:phosphoribosylamine--glycine ligase [Halobacteriovoraceae bacterium]MBT5094271.1 phosphoribosylamine--glycine ligase [Halobacteriovoraceae bacterium]